MEYFPWSTGFAYGEDETGARFRYYSYDVWGNEEDGYEVNNVFRTGDTVSINIEASDRELFDSLSRQGFLTGDLNPDLFETDGDDEIIILTYDGRPEGELRRE